MLGLFCDSQKARHPPKSLKQNGTDFTEWLWFLHIPGPSAHVVCLEPKETLFGLGGALFLGPLLLFDLGEEPRRAGEGPGAWGDRPRLLQPGCPAVS